MVTSGICLSVSKDLAGFERQWSCFFSSMDLESHLSILELSEAQAGEVGPLLLHLRMHQSCLKGGVSLLTVCVSLLSRSALITPTA